MLIFDGLQATENALNCDIATLSDERSSSLCVLEKSPPGEGEVDDTGNTNARFAFQRADVLLDKHFERNAVNRAMNTVNSTTGKDISRRAGINSIGVLVRTVWIWNDTPKRDKLVTV